LQARDVSDITGLSHRRPEAPAAGRFDAQPLAGI
jgi:hypothetical protein